MAPMVLLDGKKLSEKILNAVKQEIKALKKKLRLAVIVVGNDPVVRKFIEQKKKAAEALDIEVRMYPFELAITTSELRSQSAEIVHEKKNSGVIVQLPLPEHINRQYILNAVTPEKDVDVLSARSLGNFVVGKNPVMPPVAGAIRAFFEEYSIEYRGKHVAMVGAGNLVGRPVLLWLLGEEVTISIVRSSTEHMERIVRHADIVIAGVGHPKLITGDMIKKGAVVLDAGTSESEGKIIGDVDFESVAPHTSFITPVPGGIGPVTVAMLFKNLVALQRDRGITEFPIIIDRKD